MDVQKGFECLKAFLTNLDLGRFSKGTINYNLIRLSNAIDPNKDIKEYLKEAQKMGKDIVEKRISYDESLTKLSQPIKRN